MQSVKKKGERNKSKQRMDGIVFATSQICGEISSKSPPASSAPDCKLSEMGNYNPTPWCHLKRTHCPSCKGKMPSVSRIALEDLFWSSAEKLISLFFLYNSSLHASARGEISVSAPNQSPHPTTSYRSLSSSI